METFVKICVGILLITALAFVLSLPIMWLWNEVMPRIFGLVTITLKEALYLSLLTGLLFRSSSNNSN